MRCCMNACCAGDTDCHGSFVAASCLAFNGPRFPSGPQRSSTAGNQLFCAADFRFCAMWLLQFQTLQDDIEFDGMFQTLKPAGATPAVILILPSAQNCPSVFHSAISLYSLLLVYDCCPRQEKLGRLVCGGAFLASHSAATMFTRSAATLTFNEYCHLISDDLQQAKLHDPLLSTTGNSLSTCIKPSQNGLDRLVRRWHFR